MLRGVMIIMIIRSTNPIRIALPLERARRLRTLVTPCLPPRFVGGGATIGGFWLEARTVGSIGLEGVRGTVGLCASGGAAGVVGFSRLGLEASVVFSVLAGCKVGRDSSGCLMRMVRIKAP